MRVQTKLLIAILLGALAGPGDGHAQAANDLGQTVSRHVQELLPDNNLGGVAVALRVNGKTSLYNYGMADAARQQPITSDSIFNLASVGKLFATTLLADAVKRGEMRLDDPVARYVTELQKGGDIQEVTLGQIASHTSGLPREPGQYETWHRGKYTLPDFIRFLNDWQADPQHEPGKQDIYSNLAMILLRLALERRFHEPFATLMKERITGPLGMDFNRAAALAGAARSRGPGLWPAGPGDRAARHRNLKQYGFRGCRPDLFFAARHGGVSDRQHGRTAGSPRAAGRDGVRPARRVHGQPAFHSSAGLADCAAG